MNTRTPVPIIRILRFKPHKPSSPSWQSQASDKITASYCKQGVHIDIAVVGVKFDTDRRNYSNSSEFLHQHSDIRKNPNDAARWRSGEEEESRKNFKDSNFGTESVQVDSNSSSTDSSVRNFCTDTARIRLCHNAIKSTFQQFVLVPRIGTMSASPEKVRFWNQFFRSSNSSEFLQKFSRTTEQQFSFLLAVFYNSPVRSFYTDAAIATVRSSYTDTAVATVRNSKRQ
uniref:Uncharacterized protein n=1 Tax=Onchocerca volvulus TaxID=6282 RepID=A0A8R1TXU5_ONCVO